MIAQWLIRLWRRMTPRVWRTILAVLVLLGALAAAVYLAVGYPRAGGSVIFVIAGVWSFLALSVPPRSAR